MPGLAQISGTQRNSLNGIPLVGALAYFYAGGTTTPLVVYQDYTLGSSHTFPLVTDSYGVWPDIYLDETDELFYRLRITDAQGNLLRDTDLIPVIGPTVSEGDPAVPVDQNALLKTGDTVHSLRTGARTAFVRANGRSIGSAVSSATERADADTQALFEFYWPVTELAVSTGRGASAAADWAANKRLSLPDYRLGGPLGLDDMGTTARYSITGGTTLGKAFGAPTVTLTTAQAPAHTHTGTTNTDGTHGHQTRILAAPQTGTSTTETGGFLLRTEISGYPVQNYSAFSGTADNTAGRQIGGVGSTHSHAFTTASTGGGTAHENLIPGNLGTWYIKL